MIHKKKYLNLLRELAFTQYKLKDQSTFFGFMWSFLNPLIMVLWVSLLLSYLYVFVRDTDHLYQVFLRLLFFVTPTFYGLSFLGEGFAKNIVLLNPLTHLINFSRTIIIEGRFFSIELMLLFVLINSALIYFAFKIFKKFEPKFAEH